MLNPSVDISKIKTIRLRTSPSYLPEAFRNRTKRIRIKWRPFTGEKRVLRRKKPMQPSEWAPKKRVVTYGPLKGSRWDNSFMPHSRGIMDASFWPSVRMIGDIKVPQSGASARNETLVGYISDRKPADIVITYPDQNTTEKRCNNYLQPMFTESPQLKGLLTGKDNDATASQIRLKTLLIHMGWSGSITSLGNISAKYLFGDELDKWVQFPSKKETSSYLLWLERFRSFLYGAKAWLTSTPSDETGFIWVYMINEADVIFDYWIDCQDCGHHQPLDFKQVKLLEKERDPKEIVNRDLARYCCAGCGVMLTDRQRKKALETGVWHAIGNGKTFEKLVDGEQVERDGRELFTYLREVNPKKIGFHSHALVTKLVSLNEIIARWFSGLKDDAAMTYYDTQIRAIRHRPFQKSRKESAIYLLADERPEGLVPGGGRVAALVAAADTQGIDSQGGSPFEIRAFGWGLEQESWQIRFGVAQSLAELGKIIFETDYRDADGLYYPVHICVIDAMGRRTTEVYDWVRRYPGRAQAYKGGAGRKANPFVRTKIDCYPGTKTQIPGGVTLYTADVHHYKDQFAAKLRIKPDDPGAWHFHSGVREFDKNGNDDPHGQDYAAQVCAEHLDGRNLWTCKKGVANHYGDVSHMLLLGADILQIKYWPQGG